MVIKGHHLRRLSDFSGSLYKYSNFSICQGLPIKTTLKKSKDKIKKALLKYQQGQTLNCEKTKSNMNQKKQQKISVNQWLIQGCW